MQISHGIRLAIINIFYLCSFFGCHRISSIRTNFPWIYFLLLVFYMPLSSQAQEPSYALSTGKQDQVRLTILNELHNPSTLSKLNIIPGIRILTIGCGIGLLESEMISQATPGGYVLGTDISNEQILIAQQNCHSQNLEFCQMDVLNIDQVPGTFDRIHCRYVLTHLPWEKILKIIPLLYDKLAPGGFLLLEETSTTSSLFCEPNHLGYDLWKIAVSKQFALQKSDLSPGLRILQHLQEQKYQLLYSSYQPILSTQREKSLLSLGVLSLSQKLLKEQLFSVEELDKMLLLLLELEQNPAYFPRYNEVSQIILLKP